MCPGSARQLVPPPVTLDSLGLDPAVEQDQRAQGVEHRDPIVWEGGAGVVEEDQLRKGGVEGQHGDFPERGDEITADSEEAQSCEGGQSVKLDQQVERCVQELQGGCRAQPLESLQTIVAEVDFDE